MATGRDTDGVAPLRGAEALEFRRVVLDFYARQGRSFPWRETSDPWRILVSEVMLQQTQTHRALPKYLAWFERFPDADSLARADLAEVYGAWKGLGYNSRAMRLRECARAIMRDHGGTVPCGERELLSLPCIGSYSARAIRAFAFGEPGAVLETNIRAALLFHFFPGMEKVPDKLLEPVALAVMDAGDPRRWYYALMDYGAWLKKVEPNPARASAVYARQSRFEGSPRQARGALLRVLEGAGGALSMDEAVSLAGMERSRLEKAARELAAEGFVAYEGDSVRFGG